MTSMHEDFKRDEDVKGSSDRTFGLVFVGFFTIVGSIKLWFGSDLYLYWYGAAALFLVLALAVPKVLAPLNKLWMKFGLLLHMVISPIFIGLIFFVTVTPIGLLMRLFGKDPLRKSFDASAPTYWISREPAGPEPASMKNQF